MPRLPTILVMGSHAISTNWPGSRLDCVGSGMTVVIRLLFSLIAWCPTAEGLRSANRLDDAHLPGAGRSGFQFRAGGGPLGLLVDRTGGDWAQTADPPAIHPRPCCGHLAARRLVHERHELVREAGHRAADADAADVRAAAHAVDPAPLGHVALDHGTPAAQLDQALRRAVLGGEVTFFVV